jgi:hypothetical protein
VPVRVRAGCVSGQEKILGGLLAEPDFQITIQLRDLADVYPFLDRVRETEASLISLSITELG